MTPLLNLSLNPRFHVDGQGRLAVRLLDEGAPGWRVLEAIPRLLRRTLGLAAANRIVDALANDDRDVSFFQKALDAFSLRTSWPADSVARVPRHGPLLVVANHPRNGLDGLALAHLVSQVRDDVKVLMTSALGGIPGMADHGIFVCAASGPGAASRSEPTRRAIQWLRQGHALIVFPAGEGSYVSAGDGLPVDPPWQTGVSLLLRRSAATVLPVLVDGAPSLAFQWLRRLCHPLATFLLVREMIRQQGDTIRLIPRSPVSCEEVLRQGGAEKQVRFLRDMTYNIRQ